MKSRVGIYAGTFDPVHAGHIAFALQAVKHAKLDKLYFLPERKPRLKKSATHFGHRVAMLKKALAPHPSLEVLELEDTNFTVLRTLARLKRQFGSAQLVFLMGSDTAKHLKRWPNAERLLANNEFIIGIRGEDDGEGIGEVVQSWRAIPKSVSVLASYAPTVSSSQIRQALQRGQRSKGLLTSVERYSGQNWLYVSLAPR